MTDRPERLPRRIPLPLALMGRPRIMRHAVHHPDWRLPPLRVAVLSDLHACAPWTPLHAIRRIVAMTNRLGADLILLAGDYIADRNLPGRFIPADAVVEALSPLQAPLGVYAVLGNHDWWDCMLSRRSGFARNSVAEALDASPITRLTNTALPVAHGSETFWLVGLDSQQARKHLRRPGFDDAEAAFAGVPSGAPTILLAHEPDIFADHRHQAILQVSGHTHGGQMNLAGWRPIVPSRFGARYAWGHIREGGRHLIVSGGIGYSGLPLRILQPPEITLVTLGFAG